MDLTLGHSYYVAGGPHVNLPLQVKFLLQLNYLSAHSEESAVVTLHRLAP